LDTATQATSASWACAIVHFYVDRSLRKSLFYAAGKEIEDQQHVWIKKSAHYRPRGKSTQLRTPCHKFLASLRHCLAACRKANRLLGMINRTIKHKSKSVLLSLCHLEYCTPAWSAHYAKDKHLLQKVQHRFTRMIRTWYDGITIIGPKDRLQQLDLCTLEKRRNRADLLEMFNMLIGKSSQKFESLFEINKCFISYKRSFSQTCQAPL